jgi:hypothetical protein
MLQSMKKLFTNVSECGILIRVEGNTLKCIEKESDRSYL